MFLYILLTVTKYYPVSVAELEWHFERTRFNFQIRTVFAQVVCVLFF